MFWNHDEDGQLWYLLAICLSLFTLAIGNGWVQFFFGVVPAAAIFIWRYQVVKREYAEPEE